LLALTVPGLSRSFISGHRRPMKWVKVDGRLEMTATMAPGLDDRLDAISRLADELRIVSRLQFGTPITVPAWPQPDQAWAPRRVSSRTIGRVAWTVGFVLVLTEGWTAASAVLGAPPRPSLVPNIPAARSLPPSP
jgi:hypothetical protein